MAFSGGCNAIIALQPPESSFFSKVVKEHSFLKQHSTAFGDTSTDLILYIFKKILFVFVQPQPGLLGFFLTV